MVGQLNIEDLQWQDRSEHSYWLLLVSLVFLIAQAAHADHPRPFVDWNPESYSGCGGDVPAFPGAEGYGAHQTCGGRGGKIIEVTNLDDNGSEKAPLAGSLRAALEEHNREGAGTLLSRDRTQSS